MQSLGGGHSSTRILPRYCVLVHACTCSGPLGDRLSPAWLVFETVTYLPAKREILHFCGASSETNKRQE